MKSWEIGAIAGLIAGLVAGLIAVFIIVPFLFRLGLPFYYIPITFKVTDIPFLKLTSIEIILSIIWGVIFGIIYSKIYNSIPGKGVLKGFVYGLGIYLILGIRIASYYNFYGETQKAISWIFTIFIWIALGLMLGFLYESLHKKIDIPKKELRIGLHTLTNGIHPGAFAGLAGGIVLSIAGIAGYFIGVFPSVISNPDIIFILYRYGSHILFNMCWGIIFGILFVLFYEKIPKEGISKGFIFSLILFLITSFRVAIGYAAYGYLEHSFIFSILSLIMFIVVGSSLGYLYKK